MAPRGRGNVRVYIDGDSSGLGRATQEAETHFGRLGAGVTRAGDKMAQVGSTLNRGVTLPVLAIGAAGGKVAVDFDKSMRNVNSIAQLPEKQLQRLEKRVLGLAGSTAQAPRTLAEGLYDLVSSGFDADESLSILDKSARAATAGLTTTEISTAAVAAVLNAYHLKAGQAGRTSDQLFETVNCGVISFEDLAQNVGDVLPFASSLDVGLGQVGASIATMTKQGISAPETMTRIKNVMVTLLKPGEDLSKALDKVGMSGEELVRKKGFQGALEAIISTTDGSKESISKLFPNIRALGGVLALTGDNARSAQQDLAAFKDTTGATDKALSEQSKSVSFKWNKFKSELEATAVEAAPMFLEVGKEVVGELGDMVRWFDKLSPSTKSAIVQIGLLTAALGPLLTIGGNLLRVVGGTIRLADKAAGAFRTIGTGAAAAQAGATAPVVAGGAAARKPSGRFAGVQATYGTYELARSFGRGRAASTVAQAGATGGALARSLAGGLAGALGPALAAIGIGKIIMSATSGDWKSAGFEAGGALAGGIAGFFIGGPAGAAIGAGLGTFLGDAVGDLFGGSEVSALQERLARSAESVAAAYRKQQEASRGLEQSDARVTRTRRRHRGATEAVAEAERQLGRARRQSGPNSKPAIQAEVDLARAKRQVVKAQRAQRSAERLHGQELRATKELMRVAVLEERHRINVLKDERRAILEKRRAMKAEGASLQELRPLNERFLDNSKKLRKAHSQYSQTLLDASRQAGPQFAKFLRSSSQAALDLGRNATKLKDISPLLMNSATKAKAFGKASSKASGEARRGYEKTKGVLGPFRSETQRQLGRATGDVKSFATGTKGGFGEVETALGTALTNLGVKSVSFTTAEKKAKGGMARVPGAGREDTVPLLVNGALSAIVAPGEDLIVANRHQRPELDFAVASAFGDRGLDGFFQRSNRPHNFAKGGIPKPSLSGPDPMQDMGQSAIDQVHKAAVRYLKKHAAPPRVQKMLSFAEQEAAKGYPYVFGGGHGQIGVGPYDCSGFVSAILNAGNFISTPMTVAQGTGLYTYGQSGPGRFVTWGVRGSSGANAHTMIRLTVGSKDHYFESGSGHGAAKVGGWSGAFALRHPEGFREGGIVPTSVAKAVAVHGREAFDPSSPHFVGWGFNRGGVSKGRAATSLGTEFQERAQRIWRSAAPYYGRPGAAAMPRTWATGALPGGRAHMAAFEDGSRAVYLGRKYANGVLEEDPGAQRTLVHEWAHFHQPEINKRLREGRAWELEGGAEAFARWASPRIYEKAGLYYANPGRAGYPEHTRRVIKEKGWPWIRRGQFVRGKAIGGRIGRFAGGGVVNSMAQVLFNHGFDKEAVAGIIGNAWGESSWNPGATDGAGNGGLFGFTTSPVSLEDLKRFADKQGVPWTNAKMQTQFMLHHGEPTGLELRNKLNAADSVADTTKIFMEEWERPGTPREDDRIEGAEKAYKMIAGMGPGGKEGRDPSEVPSKGRFKLSYEEKLAKADTRIAKAETTRQVKDDRRAIAAKLDLMRGRKAYLEKKVAGITKKLKGKLKPAARERLLQQREGFLSELAGMPGEASSLVESLRETGLGPKALRKHAKGFGIGTADPNAEPPTPRDHADLALARAELTASKDDDLAALQQLLAVSKEELKAAKRTRDPRKIAEATRNLKDAAEALRDATPTAQDFANRDLALAELTEGIEDDRAALDRLKAIAEQELAVALQTADPRDDVEAAQNLKSLKESLDSLATTIEEAEQQRREFEEERLALDKKLVALAEAQGPAFLASFIAWIDGAIGGPLQTRGRLATGGVPAAYGR
jgi:TP901 family phage tail tape measure protein